MNKTLHTSLVRQSLARLWLILLLGIGTLLLGFGTVLRAEPQVFYAAGGKAVGGLDVVSFFTDGSPEPGRPEHGVVWKDVLWQFVSRENREAFESNPRAYAPQFGGYCAYGVSMGVVLDTDPQLWKIHEGKLYLLHSEDVWPMWMEDISGHVSKADANWPAVLLAQ